jgi:hypothetical protein
MFKPLVCLGVLLTVATSCTIKPGDYRVYRVAVHGISLGCQFKNPENYESDTYFRPAILAIYASDDNTYFLEDASTAFVGSRSGKDFSFTGDYQHHQEFEKGAFSKDFSTDERVRTLYSLNVNNKEIFGTLTEARTDNCTGSEDDCDAVMVNDRICNDVYEVFGSEVDDADIDYLLAADGVEGGHEGGG